jgi:short-subunit dehydrogenase
VGATSAIAEAVARIFAAHGDRLLLAGRNPARLQAIADDLRVRGATQVETSLFEATDYTRHPALVEEAFTRLGGLDTALIAHGTLPDQKACEASFESVREALEVNALSVISLATELANRFEHQGRGTLAVISSVAGDRGRQSNYIYGTAKAAVTTFLQGLRNRLHRSGVHVLTVKPGFVDTPMTQDFPKSHLWASSKRVARGIYRAIERRQDIAYVPGFWRAVMTVIRLIPERIFKTLRL